MDDKPHFPGGGSRIAVSLILVALLLLQSSWFFTAMFFIAGAMVLAGASENHRVWLVWMGMLVRFALFAGVRAWMEPAVEVPPL